MCPNHRVGKESEIYIHTGRVALTATLGEPEDMRAMVLFAHGSGSSRYSPRNRLLPRFSKLMGSARCCLTC